MTKEQLRAVLCFVIYSFCEFKVKMRIIVICNNVTYKTKLHITHKLTLSLRSGTGDFLVFIIIGGRKRGNQRTEKN